MHPAFLFSFSYELQPEPDRVNLGNWRILLPALPRSVFLLLELTYAHEEDQVAFSFLFCFLLPQFLFPFWPSWRNQNIGFHKWAWDSPQYS